VQGNVPHRRRLDLEATAETVIEHIVLETIMKKEKVLIVLAYRPPSHPIEPLTALLSCVIDKCLVECKTLFVMGDLNVNCEIEGHALTELFETFDLTNVVKGPTCFKSVTNPSLVDVILTNTPARVLSHVNTDIDVSDFHNLVCVITRMHAPKTQTRVITYRSYKRMDDEAFIADLSQAPLHVSNIFDDVDDQIWFHNTLVRDVIDEHAPLKQKKLKCSQVPYMNSELRKAINVKAMLKRKYNKLRTNAAWENYRRQRNAVNSLKEKSLKKHLKSKCESTKQNNGKEFWEAVTPFLSNKKASSSNVSLCVDGTVIHNQQEVCNVFNEFFVNVGMNSDAPCDSVQTAISMYSDNPSVQSIKSAHTTEDLFNFKPISMEQTETKLKHLKSNKATGHDQIPPKLLKKASHVLSVSLTPIFNRCIQAAVYPHDFKCAEVRPIFKKNDVMEMGNYRPVSILTSMSKVLEGLLCDQIMDFFDDILSPMLSAYRKKYSCVNVLLKCTEEWKKALDRNDVVGCILMDLSKAFDLIPHDLLVAKLSAYGFSTEACSLIKSYLSNRLQRVKIDTNSSDWSTLRSGVPQGSLAGPVLFNVFLNDLLLTLEPLCTVYNYADDNSLSTCHTDPHIVKTSLELAATSALEWFNNNQMKANPAKFQALVMGRNGKGEDVVFQLPGDLIIKPSEHVTLLGMCIDRNLNFSEHISRLTKKCARQINAISRVSRFLTDECRLLLFNSFVLSNLNYGCVIYHYCSLSDAKKLEALQKRSLRFCLQDFLSPYQQLLLDAKVPTLYVRRLRCILETMFKIIHDDLPPVSSSLFTPQHELYNLRRTNTLSLPLTQTVRYGTNSISYNGVSLYNSLPNDFRCSKSTAIIKKKLNTWKPNCECRNCYTCSLNVF
jgi:hypothetical protein